MPTIAAIEGDALGGGLELALCCDLRVAAETATLGLPEVRLAVTPSTGGTQRLPRIVGVGRAKELLLTGRIITAADAERIGLVNEVVPRGQAVARARAIGEEIAERGPLAVRAVKTLVDDALDRPLVQGHAAEVETSVRIFATDDLLEGRARRSWRSDHRSTAAAEAASSEVQRMSEVGRFGVFLPSYIWEGDGTERARGIKAFAREVEDLGFDSLFITDHLLAGEAVLLGVVPRAAARRWRSPPASRSASASGPRS